MLAFVAVPENSTASLLSLKSNTISVEVKGEVKNPGVYTLQTGSSIDDLLAIAQLNDESDISSINLSSLLANHDVIVIPKKVETIRISINTADKEQLVQIPSVGPSTADKIIEYREQNGPFQSIEELTNVKGIGEKKLEKMRDYICL